MLPVPILHPIVSVVYNQHARGTGLMMRRRQRRASAVTLPLIGAAHELRAELKDDVCLDNGLESRSPSVLMCSCRR